MRKTKKQINLVHCLHGNKVPMLGEDNKPVSWTEPKIRFTLSVIEEDGNYHFGASIIFKAEEQYSKKLGREISKGRALKVPFLVVKKADFSKDKIVSILHQAGYCINGASRKHLKSWKEHGLSFEGASRIFNKFVVESKDYTLDKLDVRSDELRSRGF